MFLQGGDNLFSFPRSLRRANVVDAKDTARVRWDRASMCDPLGYICVVFWLIISLCSFHRINPNIE